MGFGGWARYSWLEKDFSDRRIALLFSTTVAFKLDTIKKKYTWLHDTLLQSATLPKRDEMTHRTSISASSLILQDRDSVISSLPEGALENVPKRLGTRRLCSKSFSDPWGFLELIETGIDFVDLEFWWGIVVVFWICETCSYRFMWLITKKAARWLGYKSIDKLFKQFPLLLNYDMENIKIPWEKQAKKAGRVPNDWKSVWCIEIVLLEDVCKLFKFSGHGGRLGCPVVSIL